MVILPDSAIPLHLQFFRPPPDSSRSALRAPQALDHLFERDVPTHIDKPRRMHRNVSQVKAIKALCLQLASMARHVAQVVESLGAHPPIMKNVKGTG